MSCRRATLIPIAILAMADLVGVALLREAWRARQDKSAAQVAAAARARPASSDPAGDAPTAHAGA